MKNSLLFVLLAVVISQLVSCKDASDNKLQDENINYEDTAWEAKVIYAKNQTDTINAWTVFRKDIDITSVSEAKKSIAKVMVDSKYWFYVNGKLIVREGGLKQGPTPNKGYYDAVDISDHLVNGKNSLVFLVQYFGKDGFSHKSTKLNGFAFQLKTEKFTIVSDSTWKAWPHEAFGNTTAPHPNFRLPESNIQFNPNKGNLEFIDTDFNIKNKPNALVYADLQETVWKDPVLRPIPHWKDFGLKTYSNSPQFPLISNGDTIKLRLPYNAQVTPYFKIKAKEGDTIDIRTDHYRGGGQPNIRAEYITTSGVQEYELFGWINGEEVHYHFPQGIDILDLRYRETGYDTEFSGQFSCDDSFYNTLWEKARRTLYITMRDTYMDCPDRERAQWWGDVVLESGEAFYALDRQSDALTKKGIYELMNWQRKDSTIFSPIPAGNWNNELPTQMLSSIGTFGFWNYYWHTADRETIADNYDAIAKYLAVWKLNDQGTLVLRKGGWTWGDWGENKDMVLLFNSQYYMALDSYARMSELLGKTEEHEATISKMKAFKENYNTQFWNGTAYRSIDYKGKTDDRSQGLSVVAGLADESKYEAIFTILQNEKHASPYMEKYIVEALFQMGYEDFALQRLRERFSKMVNYPETTTLWEGWGIGAEGYGGGTTNHAWSGGGLTLLSQYVAGIYPTSAGYDTFQIKPQLGFLKEVKAIVPSIKGNIEVEISKNENLTMKVVIPKNSEAEIFIPEGYQKLSISETKLEKPLAGKSTIIKLSSGTYNLLAL
ncbi:alpha-L-rhamnosidase-related protein [Winogradskyella forsetii]|uniref:alpha-L-rhamnosidase-related protein n=1 Tax=Winogradskyella forsetii TaxID=2686077 RepID=UPI0015BB7568|nr:alpha-L-rhamnosidase C-terminal domain-containing protein [Winogradskyella forsetii]